MMSASLSARSAGTLQRTSPAGETFPFEVDDFRRQHLLEGLDEIGRTLRYEDEIAAFERAYPASLATTELP